MGWSRHILRPVARVAALHARRQVRRFLAAHRHTATVQDDLLRRLIRWSAGSAFGRDHGLASVRTYREFASAVPVGDYETHRPYVQRVMAGEVSALFAPGRRIVMYAVTSGTTGEPKHIPVTREFLADYRRGWNIFGLRALEDHPRCWLGRIVTLSSSPRERTNPGGVPCGAVSGMLAETQKWIVRRMYPVPPWVAEVRDTTARFYSVLRWAIVSDPKVLTTANPSSAVKLARTGAEHAERLIRDVRDGTFTPPGEAPPEAPRGARLPPAPAQARRLEDVLARFGRLLPRHYWDLGLLLMWTGGTLSLYLPQVRECFGQVPIRDIGLLASEGRLSLPLEDDTPAGVAEITGNFLEFVPAGQVESPRPDVLRAHEVEPGREYFIVLTNRAGLWRYNIDDRVRVTGRLGDSPVIEFLSKGLHACSITGEKLTEHQVVQAMHRAAGAAVETFTLQGHFADPPYYLLLVESADGLDAEGLARRMDRALREVNVEYDSKRSSGRLGALQAALAEPGHFARLEAEQLRHRGGRSEQYKHKYLLTEVVADAPGPPGARAGSSAGQARPPGS